VAPGGALILSGLLRSQAPLVREAYASRGLVLEVASGSGERRMPARYASRLRGSA